MDQLSSLPSPIRNLVADLGKTIEKHCRVENTDITDIISAAATILIGAIQQLPTQQYREVCVEEIVEQLRHIVYLHPGNA
jgi:hypothetical protein